MVKPELLREFKAVTAIQGETMRTVVERLLREYIEATQARAREQEAVNGNK